MSGKTTKLRKRPLPITIGVTGHIDIDPADHALAEKALGDLLDALASRFPHSPLRLITSLAEGADRLAANVFLNRKAVLSRTNPGLAGMWSVIVALPLPQDLFEADFPDSVEAFRRLVEAAEFSFSLPVRPGHRLADIKRSGEARNLQYEDASRFVASHSDILVAFWDGRDPQRRGGTCETVKMRLQGHSVTSRLHYSPLSRSASRLVHHIPVRRLQNTDQHSVAADLTGHGFYSTGVATTLSLTEDLIELDEYNAAVGRFVNDPRFDKSIEYSMGELVREQVLSSEMGYARRTCLEAFATADALAVYFEARWRLATKLIYGLGLCTALLLPLAIEGMFMPWAMIGYFLLLGVAFCILLFMHWARVENRHIESRALAELLRVQFAWLHSGIEDPSNPVNREHPADMMISIAVSQVLLGQQQVDLGWINKVMSHLILVERTDGGSRVSVDGMAVVRDWISGQSRYFAKSTQHAERRAIQFGRLSVAFVTGGLSSALGAILLSLFGHELEVLRHVLVVFSAALPVAGFVLENASERFGVEAQARMRHRLHQVYEQCDELLARPGLDRVTRDRLITETGREAVAEAIMWLFLRRIKPVKVAM